MYEVTGVGVLGILMSGDGDDRLKTLEKHMERMWGKLDTMADVVTELKIVNKYQVERISNMENKFIAHMENEEVETKAMHVRIDGLAKYKYVALGVASTILLLSNGNFLTFVEKMIH